MRRLLLSCVSCSLLVACGSSQTVTSVPLIDRLSNPLFAYAYYQDRTQHMVSIIINQDPSLKDPAVRRAVEAMQQRSLQAAREADTRRKSGVGGQFVRANDLISGQALLLENMLYLSPDFAMPPGIDPHVYLSNSIDPRDAAFPDPTAIDLGPLQTHIGEQAYAAQQAAENTPWRTVVIHDAALKRTMAFVQLQPEN